MKTQILEDAISDIEVSPKLQKNLTPEELAYLAGYFDGEGSINFQTAHGSYYLFISLQTGDLASLERFAAAFGGKVRAVKRNSRPHSRVKRQMYCWRKQGTYAQSVLCQLLPFLIAKKFAADLALQVPFRPYQYPQPPLTTEERELRAKVAAQISAFNRRVTAWENAN